jgi:hypothetical protein
MITKNDVSDFLEFLITLISFIKLFFLQVNRKSKFQVFTLDFWIKNTWFQLFSPWPKMICGYLIHKKITEVLEIVVISYESF